MEEVKNCLVRCEEGDGVAVKVDDRVVSVNWMGHVHNRKATSESRL